MRHDDSGQVLAFYAVLLPIVLLPLAAHIRHSLEQEASGQLHEKPFLRLLSEQLDAAEAERVLHTVITWGRHGEVFEYDYNTGVIRLPTGDEIGANDTA